MKNRYDSPKVPLVAIQQFTDNEVVKEEKADQSIQEPALVSNEKETYLPIKSIDPSPYQPRLEFDEDELQLLASSISEVGLLNPIRVRKLITGRYELIAGERRKRAYELLQKEAIPAIVVFATNEDAAIEALTENEARKDLCDYERGKSFDLILKSGAVSSQGLLSRKVGIPKTTIHRCLSFLKLPQEALSILDQYPSAIGGSTVKHFLEPGIIEFTDVIVDAINLVIHDGYTEVEAVEWARTKVASKKDAVVIAPRQVILNGVHYADLTIRGRSIYISCLRDVNPEDLWIKLSEALKEK